MCRCGTAPKWEFRNGLILMQIYDLWRLTAGTDAEEQCSAANFGVVTVREALEGSDAGVTV